MNVVNQCVSLKVCLALQILCFWVLSLAQSSFSSFSWQAQFCNAAILFRAWALAIQLPLSVNLSLDR